MTAIRFSTYEFDADPSLMTPHLEGARSGTTQRVNTGVTTYSTYQPAQDALRDAMQAAPYESTRVGSGPISYSFDSGEVTSAGGPVRHVMSFDGTPGGSVAATVQNQGAFKTVELIPGNPATRTTVQAAIRAGLIEKDGRGGYRDTATVQDAVQAVTQEMNPQAAPEAQQDAHFLPAEVQQWAQAIEPIPQQLYDAGVARALDAAAKGGTMDHVVMSLARDVGMAPEEAAAVVTQGVQTYTAAVERALARVGVTAAEREDLYAWMRKEEPGHMRHALQQLVLGQRTEEFTKLAMRWQTAKMVRR